MRRRVSAGIVPYQSGTWLACGAGGHRLHTSCATEEIPPFGGFAATTDSSALEHLLVNQVVIIEKIDPAAGNEVQRLIALRVSR